MDYPENLNIYYQPKVHIDMIVHSLEDGTEQGMPIDEYAGCEVDDKGVTTIYYYTDWDDCPTDGYPIRESKEEVEALYKEARRIYSQEYNNVTVVPKNYKTEVVNEICQWLNSKLGTSQYCVGPVNVEKVIEDLQKDVL